MADIRSALVGNWTLIVLCDKTHTTMAQCDPHDQQKQIHYW